MALFVPSLCLVVKPVVVRLVALAWRVCLFPKRPVCLYRVIDVRKGINFMVHPYTELRRHFSVKVRFFFFRSRIGRYSRQEACHDEGQHMCHGQRCFYRQRSSTPLPLECDLRIHITFVVTRQALELCIGFHSLFCFTTVVCICLWVTYS